MTSTAIQKQIDPLERRKGELASRLASIDRELVDVTAQRARTLAGSDTANVTPCNDRIRRLREERNAAADAIAHLEGELAPLAEQLHRAIQLEEQASAHRDYHAALDTAIAAKEALRATMRDFLAQFAE